MNLDLEQARLHSVDRNIKRAEEALMEQRLLLARLSACGQPTSAAAVAIEELEKVLMQHHAHRQIILNRLGEAAPPPGNLHTKARPSAT